MMRIARLLLAASVAVAGSATSCVAASAKVAIVQVPMKSDYKKLKAISSETPPKDKESEKALIIAKIRQAEAAADETLATCMSSRTSFNVLKDSETIALTGRLDLAHEDRSIPAEALHEFKNRTGAQAILRYRITDYGRTPRKWLKWIYAGTAAWIGTVIGVAATRPETRPYIGAYIGTEVLQEGAELMLGTSFIGYEYKPVRVEGELIDTVTGKVLWEAARTRSATGKMMKAYPKEQRKRKEIQLAVATERTLDALAQSLSRYQLAP